MEKVIIKILMFVKKVIIKILVFVKNMLSSGTPESCKRVSGIIGFSCFIIFVALWRRDEIELLGYLSVSLLGLEAVTNIFSKNK